MAKKPRVDYQEYLQSEAWQIRRKWKMEEADFRCQLCNKTGELHVHHRTYDRLGEERENDLTVLCKDCHAKFHDKPHVESEKEEYDRIMSKVVHGLLDSGWVGESEFGALFNDLSATVGTEAVLFVHTRPQAPSRLALDLFANLLAYEYRRPLRWHVTARQSQPGEVESETVEEVSP